MAAAEPGHVALCNRFARLIIDALPLEVDNFPVEHHDGPGHGHARLGENGPPVGLPFYPVIPTIKRPISTEIDKLSGIFFGKQIAPALAARVRS